MNLSGGLIVRTDGDHELIHEISIEDKFGSNAIPVWPSAGETSLWF